MQSEILYSVFNITGHLTLQRSREVFSYNYLGFTRRSVVVWLWQGNTKIFLRLCKEKYNTVVISTQLRHSSSIYVYEIFFTSQNIFWGYHKGVWFDLWVSAPVPSWPSRACREQQGRLFLTPRLNPEILELQMNLHEILQCLEKAHTRG